MSAPQPLTAEQLSLAYRQLRRPGWPPEADALQHAVYGPCIRGLARSLSRRAPGDGATRSPIQQRTVGLPVPPEPQPRERVVKPGPNVWSMRRPASFVEQLARDAAAGTARGRTGAHDAKRAAANDRDD